MVPLEEIQYALHHISQVHIWFSCTIFVKLRSTMMNPDLPVTLMTQGKYNYVQIRIPVYTVKKRTE